MNNTNDLRINSKKIELAEKLIQKFKEDFLEQLDVIPTVEYDLKELHLTLGLLESIINKIAKKKYHYLNIDNFVTSKSRKREVVLSRQLFAYFARLNDFPLMRIGEKIGFDHSTIVHSKKTVEEKLFINDKLITTYYEEIKNEIEKRITSNGDVQSDREESSDPESVLPFMLDEGIY
jgi:chromosomal replication initiation ATPase DnaA